MDLINFSAEPTNKLYGWLPRDLQAEKVIFFPDACPGKSPLPTGTVVFTKQPDWRKFAVSDCGCGMLLAKSEIKRTDFKKGNWDKIYHDLKANKGKLGDLGSGNHFLDALEAFDDDYIYFLIHTGSRNESKIVDHLIDKPTEFDKVFLDVCNWAEDNRQTISDIVSKYFGKLEKIVDRNHNNFELTDNGVIIRKGAIRINPNELAVLPSNLDGDVVLVKSTSKVLDTFNSLNHGTGRVMSRSEAKLHSDNYDYHGLRERIYIPEMIKDVSIKTEAPFCYRDLDACLTLIDDLILIEKRFSPFAYLGQI
jgi:RNA-splicing ligase RtcB